MKCLLRNLLFVISLLFIAESFSNTQMHTTTTITCFENSTKMNIQVNQGGKGLGTPIPAGTTKCYKFSFSTSTKPIFSFRSEFLITLFGESCSGMNCWIGGAHYITVNKVGNITSYKNNDKWCVAKDKCVTAKLVKHKYGINTFRIIQKK